jgi:hypothetical protein
MDDMRDRYKIPGSDRPVHEALRHVYQPPPRAHAPPIRSQRPHVPVNRTPDAHPQPLPTLVEPAPARLRHNKRPKTRLWRHLAVLTVILAALGAGGFFGYQKLNIHNPFPDGIRSQSKLDLLYPAKLPAGYTVNKQNMSLSNGVLIYDATDKDGRRLVFTIQPAPANFDFNAFYKQQLTNNQQYPTSLGTAVIGKNSNRPLGSLVDDDTWLLLSTNSQDVSFNDMSLVLTHLKSY